RSAAASSSPRLSSRASEQPIASTPSCHLIPQIHRDITVRFPKKGKVMSTKSIPTASINREAAAALIDAALAAAREIGIEAAVAVTDATGHLRAFERTDGAPFL